MLDRGTKVSGLDGGDKGQNGLEVVEGHLNGYDCWRQLIAERISDVFDLGERPVGFENVEAGKAVKPVIKGAQDGKGWRRTDSVHAVAGADHMTAPAMGERQGFSLVTISRYLDRGDFNPGCFRRGEEGPAAGRVAGDGPQADFRGHPVEKPARMARSFCTIGYAGIPNMRKTVKDSVGLWAWLVCHNQIGAGIAMIKGNLYAGLE